MAKLSKGGFNIILQAPSIKPLAVDSGERCGPCFLRDDVTLDHYVSMTEKNGKEGGGGVRVLRLTNS